MKAPSALHDRCAKCGACTAVCPVYRECGRESLTARGRIHLAARLPGDWRGSALMPDIFSRCLLCGACGDACPRAIDILEMVRGGREALPEQESRAAQKKRLARKVVASPALLRALGLTAAAWRAAERLIPAASGLRLRLGLASEGPEFSAPPSGPASEETGPPDALYFPGCLAAYLEPSIRRASQQVFAGLCRTRTVIPGAAVCCGMAATAAGDPATARKLAIRNIRAFSGPGRENLPILTSCATCYAQLRSYGEILGNDAKWAVKAAAFSGRVREFSRFVLTNATRKETGTPRRERKGAHIMVYHDPCHLRFRHGRRRTIIEEPRRVLTELAGARLAEMPHGPRCCGHGGLFAIGHAEMSWRIGQRAKDDFLETRAMGVTTTCTGCLLQWRRLLADTGRQAGHLAVLLARAILSGRP